MSNRFALLAAATWTIAVASSAHAAGATAKDRDEAVCIQSETRPNHIRSLDPVLERAVEEGLARSPSFRRLVERIEQLNGIVYLSAGAVMRAGFPGQDHARISGATSLDVVVAGDYRILRASVERGSVNRTVATIGHELQHVVEILETPEATDRRSTERLYTRIGFLASAGTYETTAAQEAGYRVFKELSRCAPSAAH